MLNVSPEVYDFERTLQQLQPLERLLLQVAFEHRWTALELKYLGNQIRLKISAPVLHQVAARLVLRGLLCLQGERCQLTWTGVGVVNWLLQISLCRGEPSRPRLDENGDQISIASCEHYRAFWGAPGYCWCGHPRVQHPGEEANPQEVLARDHQGLHDWPSRPWTER